MRVVSIIAQIYDLPPYEQVDLANLFGNYMDIHKLSHRQTSQPTGGVYRHDAACWKCWITGKYARKKLCDIELEELITVA